MSGQDGDFEEKIQPIFGKHQLVSVGFILSKESDKKKI